MPPSTPPRSRRQSFPCGRASCVLLRLISLAGCSSRLAETEQRWCRGELPAFLRSPPENRTRIVRIRDPCVRPEPTRTTRRLPSEQLDQIASVVLDDGVALDAPARGVWPEKHRH